jgi:hypothetical protein
MATKHKVIIYRFETDPSVNPQASTALVEFYEIGEATVHATLFGAVSNLFTWATAEQVYQKLAASNIGNHFMVVELNQSDVPIKTIVSAGGVVTITGSSQTTDSETLNHAMIDEGMTEAELTNELNRLLDKIQARGKNSLSKQELARLQHLSAR